MLSIRMILASIVLLGISGLPGCLLSQRSSLGQKVSIVFMLIGSLIGLGGVALALSEATSPALCIPWMLPWGQFSVTIDSLSAIFLAPVFIVPALGSIYGLGYWKQSEHSENSRQLGLSYGLLAGSMALVAIARDSVLFLIAWEVMAMAAYFAASVDDDNPDVRQAGWVYLVATHIGTLCLIAMFALWHQATGSFALMPIHIIPQNIAGILFVLTLIGFGFKAGLMPLHLWLPGAHANAPSHVSAVMSGVMLKMGVYGIVRMTALMPVPAAWWGGVMLAVGAITGVAGIAFAIGQHDLKRALAYSSIENIGIIALGLGLALLGRFQGRLDWVLLGLGGALLHVWNHSLFKSLLFFNAGAIIHATNTRNMNLLGGLAKMMPRVMALFAVGAVAISALPPLNGFASEWLLYVGLFRTMGFGLDPGLPWAAISAVALSMIGALAVACFVKMFGTIFLGSPRCTLSDHAHDPSASMLAPMAFLSAGCAFLGLFPAIATPLLENAVRTWAGSLESTTTIAMIAPLNWITAFGLMLIVLVGVIVVTLKTLLRSKEVVNTGTWDCGYAQPTSRMQYTGSSFGQSLVIFFRCILLPKKHCPAVIDIFPRSAHFKSDVPDTVLDRLIMPLFLIAERYLPRFHVLQQGQTYLYVLYILIMVVVLLVWGGNV